MYIMTPKIRTPLVNQDTVCLAKGVRIRGIPLYTMDALSAHGRLGTRLPVMRSKLNHNTMSERKQRKGRMEEWNQRGLEEGGMDDAD